MKQPKLDSLPRVELIKLAHDTEIKARRKANNLRKMNASAYIVDDPYYTSISAKAFPNYTKWNNQSLINRIKEAQSFLDNPRSTPTGYKNAEVASNIGMLKSLGVITVRPESVVLDDEEFAELYAATYNMVGQEKMDYIQNYFKNKANLLQPWQTSVSKYLKDVAKAEYKTLKDQYEYLIGQGVNMDDIMFTVRQADKTHSKQDFYEVVKEVTEAFEEFTVGNFTMPTDEWVSERFPLVPKHIVAELREKSHNNPALFRGLLKSQQLIYEHDEDLAFYDGAFFDDDLF